MSAQNAREQVDQDPGNLTLSAKEPQGRQPVKLALTSPVDLRRLLFPNGQHTMVKAMLSCQ